MFITLRKVQRTDLSTRKNPIKYFVKSPTNRRAASIYMFCIALLSSAASYGDYSSCITDAQNKCNTTTDANGYGNATECMQRETTFCEEEAQMGGVLPTVPVTADPWDDWFNIPLEFLLPRG